MTDTEATRRHALLNILAGHCGETLTPDKVEQIAEELYSETTEGVAAWVFSQPADRRRLPSRLVPVIVPTVNAETGETAVALSDFGPVLEILKDVTARIELDARNADTRTRYMVTETAGCGCGTCQEIRRQQGRGPLETVEPDRCMVCDGTLSLAPICELCAEKYL